MQVVDASRHILQRGSTQVRKHTHIQRPSFRWALRYVPATAIPHPCTPKRGDSAVAYQEHVHALRERELIEGGPHDIMQRASRHKFHHQPIVRRSKASPHKHHDVGAPTGTAIPQADNVGAGQSSHSISQHPTIGGEPPSVTPTQSLPTLEQTERGGARPSKQPSQQVGSSTVIPDDLHFPGKRLQFGVRQFP